VHSNPLISPCECRGTSQYVHYSCFLRWISIAPETKKSLCPVCNTRYTLNPLEDLEYIPEEVPRSINYSSNPIATVGMLHYGYILIISKFRNLTYDDACVVYIGLQYIYHMSWYYIFTRNTHIKKKVLYIQTAMLSNSGILPVLHFTAAILTIFFPQSCFIVGPILGLIFQFHWANHVSILKEMNRDQMAILGVNFNTN
jgi:E3 ubiquitin-protein ligase DOA10